MSAHDSQAHAAMEAAAEQEAMWRRRVTNVLEPREPTMADQISETGWIVLNWFMTVLLTGIFAAMFWPWFRQLLKELVK